MAGQPPSADVCMTREKTIHHTREGFLTNEKKQGATYQTAVNWFQWKDNMHKGCWY